MECNDTAIISLHMIRTNSKIPKFLFTNFTGASSAQFICNGSYCMKGCYALINQGCNFINKHFGILLIITYLPDYYNALKEGSACKHSYISELFTFKMLLQISSHTTEVTEY